MKTFKYFLAAACLASQAQGSDWSLGAELSYANLTGVRAYDAAQNDNRNESEDLLAPSLLVSKAIGDRSKLSFRYTRFESIDTAGVASTTDIFGEFGGGRDVITLYRIEEEMHELTISYSYRVASIGKTGIWLGPNLSMYDSEAEFFSETRAHLRSSSSTDFAIGAEASSTIKLPGGWRAEFRYRFSNPPDRDIHLLSLAFKLKL